MGMVLHCTKPRTKGQSQSFNSIPLFLLFLLFASAACSQQAVRLKLVNKKNESIPYVTFKITSVTDSSFKQQKVSDSSGIAGFDLVAGNLYKIDASAVNYLPVEKTITPKEGKNEFVLTTDLASKTLGAVVVTSNRPIMRQEDDKTIVEPENLAASSTNAYEIMEKTPGLFVDQDGNIYLSSTTPATIYINGREMKMSAADIATMLKNLPPTAIQKIEILRTPSAKYDASGSGGVVNIVLKKGVKVGLTGSVTAGMQQGKYGNQFVGLNLNNNNGRRNSYFNLNIGNRTNLESIHTDRLFAPDSVLQQDANTKYPATNYFTSYGISDSLNAKWFVDFAGSFMYQNFDNTTDNINIIRRVNTNDIVNNSQSQVEYKGKYLRFSNGISFNRKIDSTSELANDFYFSYDRNRTSQQYNTYFSVPFISSSSGFGSPDNDRYYFTFTSDLRKKFKYRFTLETGVKASIMNYKSNADYYKTSGNTFAEDLNRSNRFDYKENINAAYIQALKTFSGFTIKGGVRLENTNMDGRQIVPADTSFKINRTDLFPYLYLSRGLMKIAGYELKGYLVYRRTISRPAYEYLNPFPRYIDLYLFETGNPALKPQFTQNYEANISVDERPIFAVGVNDTKDIFNQVVYQVDSNKKYSYRTYDNLGSNKETYFRALGAIPPGKRYFFVAGVQYNHNFYQGFYQGRPLSFEKGSWTIFSYQTFKITPLTQLILNGFARFNGQQQFYELSSFGALNLSLNQQFFKRKMTVTLSGNDVFFTNNNHFTLNQGTINAAGYRESDTRRYGINVRYNFGIRKKEEKNNMFNIDLPEKSS